MIDSALLSRVLAQVDEAELVSTLLDLIRIPSENPFDEPPRQGFREVEMAAYLERRLVALGFEVWRQEPLPDRVNLIARLPGCGQGPTLMLAGHLDTVRTIGYPDAYEAKVRDGRVYGRGACDMKAALACYVGVAAALHRAGVRLAGDLYIAGVADEEFRMIGAKYIGQHGPRVDGVIVGEPTELQICTAAKGRVSTRIITRGRAAHSSVPETGINAIVKMAQIITALEEYRQQLATVPPHPLLGTPRFTQSVIRGGVQANMVPDYCELEVDRRILPGETQDQVYAELERVLARLSTSDPELRWEITEPTWLVKAHEIASDHPLVGALRRAAVAVCGSDPGVSGFTAGSDAPEFGSPAVICGPGSLKQAHTTCEYVPIADMVAATRMYLHVILDFLG